MTQEQINTIERMAETMSKLNELLPDLQEMRDSYKAEKAKQAEIEKEAELDKENFSAEDFIKRVKEQEKNLKEHQERIKPLLR